MRAVYRLLGLIRSYGPAAVDAACARALELDVVDVRKIARMLEQAREQQPAPTAAAKVVGGPARFARENTEYRAGRRMSRTSTAAPMPPPMLDADLRKLMRTLKLGRMLDTLPERLELAKQQSMPYADFLSLVFADEVERRDRTSRRPACPHRQTRPGHAAGDVQQRQPGPLRPRTVERAVLAAVPRRRPRRAASSAPSASERPT